jgi:hypothetical protein
MSKWFAINDAAVQAAASERKAQGRGGSTVTVYKTTAAMMAAQGGDRRTDNHKIADSVRDLWRRMRDDAVWEFQADAGLFADEELPF